MSADDLVDVRGRPRQDVGRGHPQRGRVLEEHRQVAVREVADRDPRRGGAADDLVVDVGDVHHPPDGLPAPAQVADQEVGEQERAEVADVGGAVDGRAAASRCGRSRRRSARGAASRPTACRAAAASRAQLRRGPDEGRERERRHRPSGPVRPVEVAGRCLDVDGADRQPGERRDGRAHRLEMAPEPGPRRDDRQVDRLGPPAGGRDPGDRPRPGARRCRCRPGSTVRRGTASRGRRGRRRRAAASATAWRATSPSEWPCSRGAPAMRIPPSASGSPGPNGCESWPMPVRRRRVAAERHRDRGRGRRAASP